MLRGEAAWGTEIDRRLDSGEIKETVERVEIETDLVYSGPVFGFMFKW